MKLYSGPLSMFGAKTEIAVREKGVAVDVEHVPFALTTLYEPKHPDVARINPKQQVPVLIDGDLELFDSTQIFEYLEDLKPDPPLWPRDRRARARARLLELKSDEVFFPNVVLLMPRQRALASEAQAAEAVGAIHAFYEEMERVLDGKEYLAGAFSYADIAFFMAQFFAGFLGASMPSTHARLGAWRARVGGRESVRQVTGAMVQFLKKHGLSVAAR
ncbi:MAG: glutathione S-transferase family protein [Deltaproteobacteria bacterium]|nr:glutathione S-transferase family protein [Deltaproteobacteria bacterium]